jgi:hypothetical protein
MIKGVILQARCQLEPIPTAEAKHHGELVGTEKENYLVLTKLPHEYPVMITNRPGWGENLKGLHRPTQSKEENR